MNRTQEDDAHRTEHDDLASTPPGELTVLRSWTFSPDDVELSFYVEAAFILGLMMNVENQLNDAGVRRVTVTSYVETDAIEPTQVATCWPAPANWCRIERVEACSVRGDWSAVFADPRWRTRDCRLVFVLVDDDAAAGEGGAAHLTWFAEFSHAS